MSQSTRQVLFLTALLGLAGCPGPPAAPIAPVVPVVPVAPPTWPPPSEKPSRTIAAAPANIAFPTSATGSIAGTVRLAREVEAPAPLFVTADAATCGHPYEPRSLLVKDGLVENAVVTLAKATVPPGPYDRFPPLEPVVVDQKACRYVPRVSVAAVTQPVHFRNSDPVLHTLQAKGQLTLETFDPTIPSGNAAERRFAKPDRFRLGCSIHAFMRGAGTLVVTEHPWVAVTGADGRFQLHGLPPGVYRVVVWHELLEDAKLAREGVTVHVAAGRVAELPIAYK